MVSYFVASQHSMLTAGSCRWLAGSYSRPDRLVARAQYCVCVSTQTYYPSPQVQSERQMAVRIDNFFAGPDTVRSPVCHFNLCDNQLTHLACGTLMPK